MKKKCIFNINLYDINLIIHMIYILLKPEFTLHVQYELICQMNVMKGRFSKFFAMNK